MSTITSNQNIPIGPNAPAGTAPSQEYKSASDERSVTVKQFEKLLANFSTADVDQLMQTLAELHEMTSRLQGQVSSQRIQTADIERKEAAKKMMEMLHAVLDKIKEANDAAKEDKVLGWLAAIGEAAGAALLTGFLVYTAVVTGGADAPLVAMSAMMLVTASMSIANMAAKETGATVTDSNGQTKPLDVSFSGMVDAIVAQQINDGTIVEVRKNADGNYIDKDGAIIKDPHDGAKPGAIFMTTDELSKWKMGWGITANLIVAAATLSMGYGSAEFAAKGASIANKIADGSKLVKLAHLEHAGEGMQVATGVIESVQGIYQGNMQMKLAEIDKDTDEARAWKSFYEASVKELTQRLSVVLANLHQIYDGVNKNYQGVSDTLKASTDTSESIGHHMA